MCPLFSKAKMSVLVLRKVIDASFFFFFFINLFTLVTWGSWIISLSCLSDSKR
jgi:hypothetical protein